MNPDRTPSPASLRARWLVLGALAATACGVTDLAAILLPSVGSSGAASSGAASSGSGSSGTVSSGSVSSGSATSGTVTAPASGAASGEGGGPIAIGKKGLAYGNNSPADLQALTVGRRGPDGTGGIWWWMNWTSFPDQSLASTEPAAITTASMFGIEYVPMIFNVQSVPQTVQGSTLQKQVPPNSKYLLTFNVANFTGMGFAGVLPEDAAKQWPAIENFANSYNPALEIISPTIDYCTPGPTSGCLGNYSNPIVWLDAFLDDCVGCRIDYIGVRMHTCDFMTFVSDLMLYEGHGKKIWVNEIWCDPTDPTSDADPGGSTAQYMPLALMYLDADPNVLRYAWYTGRPAPAPNGTVGTADYDILAPEAGVLTPLGECYTQPDYLQGYTQGACSVGSE
jgi:putative glycosyl hydrolase